MSIIKSSKVKRYNKYAAVLIPILEEDGEQYIVFEVRALTLRSQPGEVCFPGGKVEEYETPIEAAIRETCEEIGVNSLDIKIIDELEMLIRYDNMVVYPYVALIKNTNFSINKDEVDHVFKVPISYLKEHNPLEIVNKLTLERHKEFPYDLIKNGLSYKSRSYDYKTSFYRYDDYVIWGITAEILKRFLEIA